MSKKTQKIQERSIDWFKELKMIGIAVTLYTCYQVYSIMNSTPKSSKSAQSTQTDNECNIEKWHCLQQELSTTKQIISQKTKQENDKVMKITALNNQIQHLKSVVIGLQQSLNVTKSKLDETQLSNANTSKNLRKNYEQTIQHKEQQIQQLKHEWDTNQTHMSNLNICINELQTSKNESNQTITCLNNSVKNNHSQIQKLLQELAYIRLSAVNNKIEHYNNELFDNSKHYDLRQQKLHHIDYILDRKTFGSIIQHLFRKDTYKNTITNNEVYFPEAIVFKTYQIYHRYLNMKMSLQVDSASSNSFIFEKKYDQVMKFRTSANLSCFPFCKYNKLIVGFQIRVNKMSQSDELFQVIGDWNKEHGSKSRIGFRWICDENMQQKDTDKLMAADYYFTNGDLLGLFVDDDHFTYAFRNGIYVATGSWFPSTKRFFEEQYGFVNVKTDGEVDIECNMSNVRWKGTVCQHLKMDRDKYRTLSCNLCNPSVATYWCLPIDGYHMHSKRNKQRFEIK